MDLSPYKTLIFDCDGVILDSNTVKTEAFRTAAAPFGAAAAEDLVRYHQKHGGVSRYKKFEHFLREIVKVEVTGDALRRLLAAFESEVGARLLQVEASPALPELRRLTDARWCIVSGGDQNELRALFGQRGLSSYFDAGIFGSPCTKLEILQREIERESIVQPALFLGDSRYDHEAAAHFGLDFVFVSGWSELAAWPEYCARHRLSHVGSLSDLLNLNRSTAS